MSRDEAITAPAGVDPHFHGRRRGRKLRAGQRRLLDELLPHLSVVPEHLDDPAGLFAPRADGVWLEIGFGAGEHLADQAAAHPGIGFIGVEAYLNGVARFLATVERQGLQNVRVFADDVRLLLDRLPDASIDRCFVLFPDPWPKTRHHGRRLICGPVLDALARILADGAELRLASDHDEYVRWMLFHLGRHEDFRWEAARAADWRDRPADWPPTRYEEKARSQGAACSFLRFRRLPRRAEAAEFRVAKRHKSLEKRVGLP